MSELTDAACRVKAVSFSGCWSPAQVSCSGSTITSTANEFSLTSHLEKTVLINIWQHQPSSKDESACIKFSKHSHSSIKCSTISGGFQTVWNKRINLLNAYVKYLRLWRVNSTDLACLTVMGCILKSAGLLLSVALIQRPNFTCHHRIFLLYEL